MSTEQAICAGIKNFLQAKNKKTFLLITDNESSVIKIIRQAFESEQSQRVYYDIESIQQVSKDQQCILVYYGIDKNKNLENIFTKYQLNQWQVKVIVICSPAVLHPRLDSSIYFLPIIKGRLQKHLLSKMVLNVSVPAAPVKQVFSQKVQQSDSKVDLRQHFLNQRPMTTDPAMMRMFADRALISKSFRQLLFEILNAARKNRELQIAAANTLTIFKYAHISLADSDLHEICAPNSDLSGVNLDNANCQGMDLHGSNLSGAWTREANFSGANLSDVAFGEFPIIALPEEFSDCLFSPDGKSLAVVMEEEICLYAFSNLDKWLIRLEGHFKHIIAISFLNGSQTIASGSKDGVIIKWDCATGKILKNYHLELENIRAIAFNPAGHSFAVAISDSVIVFDIETGEIEKVFDRYGVASICFSVDGRRLACISGSIIIIINISDNTETMIIDEELPDYGEISVGIFNSSATLFAVGRENCPRINIYNSDTCEKFRTLSAPRIKTRKIIFSPNDQFIAWGSEDGVVRFWEIASGALYVTLAGHSEPIKSLSISPDGEYVVAGGRSLMGGGNRELKIWRLSSQLRQESNIMVGHRHRINSISYSPRYKCLSSKGDDGVYLWRFDNGANIPFSLQKLPRKNIGSAAFNISGNYLAIGDRALYFFDIPTNTIVKTIEDAAHSYISLAFSKDGKILAVGTVMEGAILIDLENFQVKHRLKTQGTYGYCREVAFSASGKHLVTAYHIEPKIYLWDVETGGFIRKFDSGQNSTMSNIDISPDGRYIASSGQLSLFVELWSVDSDEPMYLAGHTNIIRTVSFSPDGEYLAAGSENGSVRIWEINTRQCVGCIRGIVNGISAICWISLQDNLYLATGGEDCALRLWRIFKQPDGNLKIVLCWSTQQFTLNTDLTLIGETVGLSNTNRQLLLQQGAIDSRCYPNLFKRERATQDLVSAVTANNVERVKSCLADGASSDVCDNEGKTPVRICVENNLDVILALLIAAGADIFHSDIASNNWLHEAIKRRHVKIAQQLLNAGISANKANYHGTRPVHLALNIATEEGDTAYLELLLNHGANPNLSYSESGETLVCIAAVMNWTRILELSLQKGGDVNAKTKKKMTPLHAAALSGHLEATELLLSTNPDINAQGGFGETPLSCAAQKGHVEVVKALLKRGANTELRVKDGRTPLHAAALSGHTEVVEALLERAAQVNARASGGLTALHLAVGNNDFATVAALLFNGADPNAKTDTGVTIMHVAFREGNQDILLLLKQAGARLTSDLFALLTNHLLRKPSAPTAKIPPQAQQPLHNDTDDDDEQLAAAKALSLEDLNRSPRRP